MNVLEICGLAFLGLIALVAVVLIGGSIKDSLFRRRDQIFHEGADWWRQRLKSDACWFSEDEATMKLVEDLATTDVSTARENWRHRRKGKAS